MAVQVSYPGVYIEEIPSGVHTITGVATSIAAFFGRTAKGPINKAVRCLSMSDFTREFGGSHSSSELAQSVKQFFDNGGTDCYIVRLAHNASKADVTLQRLDSTDVLKATARNAGSWGNGVRIEVDYDTPNPDETFNMRIVYEESGTEVSTESHINLSMDPASSRYAPSFVTQSSGIADLELASGVDPSADSTISGYSEGRMPFESADLADDLNALVYPSDPTAKVKSKFDISVDGSQYVTIDLRADPTWTEFTGSAANIAAEIQSRINTQLASVSSSLETVCSFEEIVTDVFVLRITSNGSPAISVRVRRSSDSDLAASLMLGLDQGGIEVVRYSDLRPVPTATVSTLDLANFNDIAALQQNSFNEVTVSGTTISLGTDLHTAPSDTDPWYSDEGTSGGGVRKKLETIAKAINAESSVPCTAEVWGYHLALIPTSGTSSSTITISTGGGTIGTDISGYFTQNVKQYSMGSTGTSGYQTTGNSGQDDDGNPLEPSDYIGVEADQTGFYALDAVDLFNLMVLPPDEDIDESDYLEIIGQASIYCQNKRAFLLIDAPPSWTQSNRPVATSIEVNSLRSLVVKDYSAIFYPRIQYSKNGIKTYTGPSGVIAGLISRIDSTRGVWKAPAGTEADLRGILDLEVNLTDKENGVLNKLGVNCLRKFPSGMVNWGGRTMDGSDDIGSEWKYIPIRRLALFIEESLFRGTKWVVFEPNDEPLWAKIRLNVGAFMMRLFRQGAFQGSTPEKAFFVKCDEETTPQSDRDLGIVNILVGFAPLKPAEFVIIQIQQIAGEL